MKATPARRQIAMGALLLLAVAGGVLRITADNPSLARDIGTLLLVLWLPAIGNLIAFLRTRLPPGKAMVIDFAPGGVFQPQLEVALSPVPGAARIAQREAQESPGEEDDLCTLLVGRQGFTVRADRPLTPVWAGPPSRIELELLRPEVALPHLPVGTAFQVLVGRSVVASGQVMGVRAGRADQLSREDGSSDSRT